MNRSEGSEGEKEEELRQDVKELTHEKEVMAERFNVEMNELNSTIIALRTKNLELVRELESKEMTIG